MPSSESYPFRRLSVDHMIRGVSRVGWEMHRNFNEPTPHIFQLQAGRTGLPDATDWVDVGTPVINGLVADDDQQRLSGKTLLTHYRVKLTTPLSVWFSNPIHVYGQMDEKDWVLCREVARKENLRHRLVSREGFLVKRLRFGVKCRKCLDPLTGEVNDSRCPECQGTGFAVGYHPPMRLCLDMTPETIEELRGATQPPGGSRYVEVTARLRSFPPAAKEDVWVDGNSDQRWFVHVVKHLVEWRGVPLVSQVVMRLAPYSHMVYRLEVGGEPAARESEPLPGTGGGSETVDHDFGGPDALAYRDAADCGIVGARILAFSRANYNAGLRDPAHACASTTTSANGRWSFALEMDPGEYVLVYEKPGEYGPDVVEIVVEGPPPVPVAVSSSDFSAV